MDSGHIVCSVKLAAWSCGLRLYGFPSCMHNFQFWLVLVLSFERYAHIVVCSTRVNDNLVVVFRDTEVKASVSNDEG